MVTVAIMTNTIIMIMVMKLMIKSAPVCPTLFPRIFFLAKHAGLLEQLSSSTKTPLQRLLLLVVVVVVVVVVTVAIMMIMITSDRIPIHGLYNR